MRLLFKQRFFSWFDKYDIYDENEKTIFTVEGKLSWGHCLHIHDSLGNHIGTVQEKVFTLLPQFQLYEQEDYIGCIRKEFTFLRPKFTLDYADWSVDGNLLEWEYTITSASRGTIATISKEVFRLTDTYVLDINDPADALRVLMVVLAIDAEMCSRGN